VAESQLIAEEVRAVGVAVARALPDVVTGRGGSVRIDAQQLAAALDRAGLLLTEARRREIEQVALRAERDPVVTVDPQVRFGRPHVKGISVGAVVEHLLAGEDPAAVADDYNLDRGDLLVACWFAARHGPSHQRQAWAGWLDRHERALAGVSWLF
jgi:uncharacterized protein (DUF433 family)